MLDSGTFGQAHGVSDDVTCLEFILYQSANVHTGFMDCFEYICTKLLPVYTFVPLRWLGTVIMLPILRVLTFSES